MALPTHHRHSGRKIMSVSRQTVRILSKMERDQNPQGLESTLQYYWGLFLWACKNVVEVQEEADKFKVPHLDTTIIYHPDYRIVLDDGQVIYLEIKPKRCAEKPVTKERLRSIKQYLAQRGFGFLVLTEAELPVCHVGISNLRRLKWFALGSKRDESDLVKHLPASPMTFSQLSSKTGDPRIVMEMMAAQLLAFDLNRPINQSTLLTTSKENDHVEFTFA